MLKKTWMQNAKRLWCEDENLLKDPDAERVESAWSRLFNEKMPEPIGNELDMGDAFAKEYPDNRVVMFDYMRCNSIWRIEQGATVDITDLITRGNITLEEYYAFRGNSWEHEAIVPALNNEAFIAYVEYVTKNCGVHVKRPVVSYPEALTLVAVPELVKRFRIALENLATTKAPLILHQCGGVTYKDKSDVEHTDMVYCDQTCNTCHHVACPCCETYCDSRGECDCDDWHGEGDKHHEDCASTDMCPCSPCVYDASPKFYLKDGTHWTTDPE